MRFSCGPLLGSLHRRFAVVFAQWRATRHLFRPQWYRLDHRFELIEHPLGEWLGRQHLQTLAHPNWKMPCESNCSGRCNLNCRLNIAAAHVGIPNGHQESCIFRRRDSDSAGHRATYGFPRLYRDFQHRPFTGSQAATRASAQVESRGKQVGCCVLVLPRQAHRLRARRRLCGFVRRQVRRTDQEGPGTRWFDHRFANVAR